MNEPQFHCTVLLVPQGHSSVKVIAVLQVVNVVARVRESSARQSVMVVGVPRERRSVHCILKN